MTLKTTTVSRCLHRKLQIAGFEIFDLLLVFFVLSILHLIFGRTDHKLLAVWLPAAILAAILRIGKHGKPENYLLHWIRYQLGAKAILAYDDPTGWQKPPRHRTPLKESLLC